MTKQYLRKREYLGIKKTNYLIKYARKIVLVKMEWISGEYQIIKAELIKDSYDEYYDDFPYKRTVKTIDRIEELLK